MMNVKLIWATPDADKIIGYCARVSNPANQDNPDVAGLLQYCARNGHWSVFEMANAVLEINTTRDIARQILRHRSFSFQEFCVSGDTLVTLVSNTGRTIKRPIAKLYEYQNNPRMDAVWDRGVRVYDESSKTFVRSKIKEVFKTGVKPCFKVTLDDGKTITCTEQHRFFTRDGFADLSSLSVGHFVAVNGVKCYQSKDWMAEAKAASLFAGCGVSHIAEAASVSYHTIRKWLKVHGLQFSKQENAIVAGGAWNKGLPKEQQPRFEKPVSDETREKMRASSRIGEASEFYVDGGSADSTFRRKVWRWQSKHKYATLLKFGNKCVRCGCESELEIDHIIPVSQDESLAFEKDNLQVLCKNCHKEKSIAESNAAKQTIRWKKIVSIEPSGEMMTYDLEVEHDSHNYIANGIVTHNSQRYADATLLGDDMVVRETRLQDTKNRQNSIETADQHLIDAWEFAQDQVRHEALKQYRQMLHMGIAKEQARALLPEGLTPSRLYVNGTLRSWITYCQVRADMSTQKEHRLIADEVIDVLRHVAPITMNAFWREAT